MKKNRDEENKTLMTERDSQRGEFSEGFPKGSGFSFDSGFTRGLFLNLGFGTHQRTVQVETPLVSLLTFVLH